MAKVSQKDLDALLDFLKSLKGKFGDAIFWTGAGIKLLDAGVHLLEEKGLNSAVPQELKTKLDWAKRQFGEVAFWTGVALLIAQHGGKLLVREKTVETIDTDKVEVVAVAEQDVEKVKALPPGEVVKFIIPRGNHKVYQLTIPEGAHGVAKLTIPEGAHGVAKLNIPLPGKKKSQG